MYKNEYKDKKNNQLGMNCGTAQHRLTRDMLFKLIQDIKQDICFHCKEKITREEFSIEHKVPWLDSINPLELFFDLNNIAFSHKDCNSGAARRPNKKEQRDYSLIGKTSDLHSDILGSTPSGSTSIKEVS